MVFSEKNVLLKMYLLLKQLGEQGGSASPRVGKEDEVDVRDGRGLCVVLHELHELRDGDLDDPLAVVELVDVEEGSRADVVVHVDLAAVDEDGVVLVHGE